MTKAVCKASFARSHYFVPDFLVSVLPKPANFFGMKSVLLIKLLFIMHFGVVYSVLTFLWKSVTTLNFGLSFSVLLAVACHCATFLPVGEGERWSVHETQY